MTRIAVPNTGGRRRSSNLIGRWVLVLVLGAVVAAGFWTWLTLTWAYADGERAGVLQRFVHRGWLCKTQEGEIALYYGGGQYMGASSSPQLWDFSVRDKSVATELSQAVGHRVQLHYTEHPGIPTGCFAETKYFVDKVTITDAEPKSGASAPAAAPSRGSATDAEAGATLPAPPPPLPAEKSP